MADRPHGTHACYVHGPTGVGNGAGCRCDPCRTANRTYEAERARRTEPPYVDATEVREHLAWLSAHGVGWKQAGTASGIPTSTIWKLVYGKPGRGPSKRCRPATRDAILTVRPDHGADGSRVPAAPTWGHIATLLERGWTKKAIAHAIGQNGDALQVGRKQVRRGTARAIAALLDQPVPERLGTTRARADLAAAKARASSVRANHRRTAEARLAPVTAAAPDPDPDDNGPDDYQLPTLDLRLDLRGAPCRRPDVPTRLFFPDPRDTETITAAKQVCATCRFANRCLEFAIAHSEAGIWGGTTDTERRALGAVA